MKAQKGVRSMALPSFNLGARDGGGWLTPRPGHITPEKDQLSIV